MKSKSSDRKTELARTLARHWALLHRLSGIPWVEHGRLRLIHAHAITRIDIRRALPYLSEPLLSWNQFGRLLGNPPTEEVNSEWIAQCSHSLRELQRSQELFDLIEEGARPLRSLRDVDVPARLITWNNRLEQISQWLEILRDYSQLQDSTSLEICQRLLELRLSSLGYWPIDPLSVLHDSNQAEKIWQYFTNTNHPLRVQQYAKAAFQEAKSRQQASWPAMLQFHLSNSLRRNLEWICRLTGRPRLALARFVDQASFLMTPEQIISLLEALPNPKANRRAKIEIIINEVSLDRCRNEVIKKRPNNEEEDANEYSKDYSALSESIHKVLEAMRDWFIGILRPLEEGEPVIREADYANWIEQHQYYGWRVAYEAMIELWKSRILDDPRRFIESWQQDWLRRWKFCWDFPQIPVASTTNIPSAALDGLQVTIENTPVKRLGELWPIIQSYNATYANHSEFYALLKSNLPLALIRKILQHQMLYRVNDWYKNIPLLERYLDLVEYHAANPIDGFDPISDWFAKIFQSGKSWVASVALQLLHRAKTNENLVWVTIIQGLEGHPRLGPLHEHWAKQLKAWQQPTLPEQTPEYDKLASLLQIEDTLVQYLHYRKLSGEQPEFSKAILEVITQQDKLDREKQHLITTLQSTTMEPKKRSKLEHRLNQLNDSDYLQTQMQDLIERAKNRLTRAAEEYREKSLQHILDQLGRETLEELLGRKLPAQPVPPSVWDAIYLLSDENVDYALLTSFLDDQLEQRPRHLRPLNQQWLENVQAKGVNTQRWLAGFRNTMTVAGRQVRIQTATNPIQVLRMGSYFGTCLTLEDGCNRASTLINALDVNKYVVYAFDHEEDKPLARKLIIANSNGQLLGYQVYTHDNHDEFYAAIHQVIIRFAKECNLQPSDEGISENIHPGFWYDDGHVSWGLNQHTPIARPAEVPADLPQDKVIEWLWWQSQKNGDDLQQNFERWKYILLQGVAISYTEQAAIQWLTYFPSEPIPNCCWEYYPFVTCLFIRCIRLQRYDLLKLSIFNRIDFGQLFGVLNQLPIAVEDVQQWAPTVLKFTYRVRQTPVYGMQLFYCPFVLGLMDIPFLSEWFDRYSAFTTPSTHELLLTYSNVVQHNKTILALSWLQKPDAEALIAAMQKDTPFKKAIITEFLIHQVVPGSERYLRRWLNQSDTKPWFYPISYWNERVALALGNQGIAWDAYRLVQLQAENPTSAALALAVIRTGNAELAELARERWIYPNPPEPTTPMEILEYWIEIGSKRLIQQIESNLESAIRNYAEETDKHRLVHIHIKPTFGKWILLKSDGDTQTIEKYMYYLARLAKQHESVILSHLQQVAQTHYYRILAKYPRLLANLHQSNEPDHKLIRQLAHQLLKWNNQSLDIPGFQWTILRQLTACSAEQKLFCIEALFEFIHSGMFYNRLAITHVLMGPISKYPTAAVWNLCKEMCRSEAFLAEPIAWNWVLHLDDADMNSIMAASKVTYWYFNSATLDYTYPRDPDKRQRKAQFFFELRKVLITRQGAWDIPKSRILDEWGPDFIAYLESTSTPDGPAL